MKQKTHIKRGQTIAAEREYAESESQRMQMRKQAKRKHRASVIVVLLLMVVLAALGYFTLQDVVRQEQDIAVEDDKEVAVTTEIVDEMGREQISERTKQYIAQIEQDFKDLGYTVTRVTLPMNSSREILIDLADQKPYFRVSLDRGTAVSAEDVVRMIKYLGQHKLTPTYADVRIEGKAYYK